MTFKDRIVEMKTSDPGMGYRRVAAAVGCSYGFVRKVCASFDLGPGNGDYYKTKIIDLALSDATLTYRQIADRVGCTYDMVRKTCVRVGLNRGNAHARHA
jgi:hypothetical protein